MRGLAQVSGNLMVAVGNFTTVTAPGGAAVSRTNIFAFDATTGAISNSFVPTVGGRINEVIASADRQTVYIAGSFTSVNGVTRSRVAQLRVSDGSLTSFKGPSINSVVNDISVANGKLYLGGGFRTVGGQQPRTALAALNATTGARDDSVNLAFTDTWNGGSVNVQQFDISVDGSRLVAIGNFRTVDGQSRPQVVQVNTAANPAVVDDWATQRYTDTCAGVFDTYMRDVDIAPSGAYFVVVTTGAYGGPSSMCDTAARWELNDGPGALPSWLDTTGGDTQTKVKITEAVVYVGGHQRWMNNPFAADTAGPGAVSREGIAALDPRNGLPLSWNPTRARNVGVTAFLPTPDGLWVGHDSNRLGGETRKRIAFLPLTGGSDLPVDSTGSLPGDVYLLGRSGAGANNGHWVARVNAGGPALLATDNGPDWDGDRGTQISPFHNGGSNDADWADLSIGRTADVPASTPQAVFSTERWDPNGDPTMQWDFPAPVGANLEVRLYFANGCSCTENAGQRVFDVNVEGGAVELDNYDIVANVGDEVGTMKSYGIVSDGNVDIDLGHVTENPLVNAIEIINTDTSAPAAGGDTTADRRTFDGQAVTNTGVLTGGPDWSSTRGAVMIDDSLFTGNTDGTLKVRTFDGSTFGPASNVDLHGLTAFANDIANITGMFFDRATGRLYYNQSGQTRLYYRYFTPESQVVGAVRFDWPDSSIVNWGNVSGIFLAGGELYYGDSTNDQLRAVNWNGSTPTGSPTVVGNGHIWQSRGMFLYAS